MNLRVEFSFFEPGPSESGLHHNARQKAEWLKRRQRSEYNGMSSIASIYWSKTAFKVLSYGIVFTEKLTDLSKSSSKCSQRRRTAGRESERRRWQRVLPWAGLNVAAMSQSAPVRLQCLVVRTRPILFLCALKGHQKVSFWGFTQAASSMSSQIFIGTFFLKRNSTFANGF